MRHPTDGTLRRLLDEPAGVTDADREHVTGCPRCRTGLARIGDDAALTRDALDGGTDTAVDVDAAWSRLSRALTTDAPDPQTVTAAVPRWRTALRKPVVAGLAAVLLLGGAGAAAAADWLQIFRTERVAPVTIAQGDLIALPDLSAFGTVRADRLDVRAVADAAAAERATGLTAPRVTDLPQGVTGAPAYQVAQKITAEFTFSAEAAARSAAAQGRTLPAPPPGLDGSRFRLSAGPGIAAVWSEARGVPALVAARVVAPTAYSAGVPFATAVDYLLALPGLPASVASQLRGFTGDGTTLPLPVNAEYLTSSTADVQGSPATVLVSRDELLAAVVWVRDGVVTAVGGSMSTDEVLAVARALEQR